MHQRNEPTLHDSPPITARAFADLYAANFLLVKAFLTRKGCAASLLDDLAQETFLRAWTARDRFSGKSSLRTWLFGIAHNVTLEARRQPRVETLENEPPGELKNSGLDADEIGAINDALAKLAPKQRMAMVLVYFEGMKPIHAAERLSCDYAVLRRRLTDGHRRLHHLLLVKDRGDQKNLRPS